MRTPPVLGDGQSGSKLLKAKKASIGALATGVAMLLLGMVGCKSIAPDAGHEVVLVEKPMFFGHGGINSEPVHAGRAFVAATTDGIDVNMQPVAYQQDLPDPMKGDGV